MTGFTLYETLRILVPGILSVMIGALSLRLAGLGFDRPVAEAVTGSIESPSVILGATLFIGLLLYAIDLPAKIRIQHEGDPERDRRIPSDTLKQLIPSLEEGRELGFYLLLSDRYLAPETRRRIYLFGSLYRIFVDLRTLLMAGLAAGVLIRVASSYSGLRTLPLRPDNDYLLEAALSGCGIIAAGSYGLVKYGARVKGKHPGEESLWTRLGSELRTVWRVLLGISFLATSTVYALSWVGGLVGGLVASIAAMLALTLWFWVEVGPPSPRGSARDGVLKWLRAQYGHTQYSPVQRLAADLSFVVPWFWAAATAGQQLGSRPGTVSLWVLLAVPASMVLSFRKHEERLLAIYEDQSVWLEYHRAELQQISTTGALPDSWD